MHFLSFSVLLMLAPPAEPTPPKTVKVAGIVLKWVRGDKEANFRRAEPLIREAAGKGARIVCTTECFLDGYAIADKSIPLETYRKLGEPIPDVTVDPRLVEISFGIYEGHLHTELASGTMAIAGERDASFWHFRPPEGESYDDVAKRVLDFGASLTGPTVIVSHGGGPQIKLASDEVTITVGPCEIKVGMDSISLNNGLIKVGLAGVSLVNGAMAFGVPPS